MTANSKRIFFKYIQHHRTPLKNNGIGSINCSIELLLNYYGRVYNFFSATLIQQERSILLHPFRKDLHVWFVTRRWSILADRMKHAIQLRCKDNRKKKKKMEAIWDRYARCTDLESTSSFFEARSIFVGDEINQTLALISPPTISRIYSVEVIRTCDCRPETILDTVHDK